MSPLRTQDEVIGEIHRQREELISAVVDVRSDLTREIEHLRRLARAQLPKAGVALGMLAAVVAALKLRRARQTTEHAIERLRVGRFSLLEHV